MYDCVFFREIRAPQSEKKILQEAIIKYPKFGLLNHNLAQDSMKETVMLTCF